MHTKSDWQSGLAPLLKAERLGLFTDFDGTLSPIVDRPEDAQILPQSRAHLSAMLGRVAALAIISGRGAADAAARLDLPGVIVLGNHGLERWEAGQAQPVPQAADFRPALTAAATDLQLLLGPGMHLEDKGITLTVHYRQAPNPDQVAQALAQPLTQVAQRYGLHLTTGRRIFELRPPIDGNKGKALRALIAEFSVDAALYLGDDITDVDAFIAARELRAEGACQAYAVAVLAAEAPPAVAAESDFTVDGPAGASELLGWLAAALSASTTWV